ncbi:MAG TPA: hypothetical protein VE398_12640 [Acidobacteriota bacterium]|nr:hypothetical protein [Acidobacteriota bacterium]
MTILRTAGMLVLMIAGTTLSRSQIPTDVTGTWEGESLCTLPTSFCHNEHVVYRISPKKDASGKYTIAADKIVDGRPVYMGDLLFTYDPARGNLRCDSPGVWELSVAGDVMKGTLKLGDGTLYRRISLHRQK